MIRPEKGAMRKNGPAWSIIVFTTLAGAGQGLFLALFAADLAGRAARHFLFIGSALAALLCVAGLVASFFHLRRPPRSWRSALLPVFIVALAGYSAAQLLSLHGWARALGFAAVLLCIALFVCMAMRPLTFLNFFALGCASGATAAAALAAGLQPALMPAYTALALALGLIAYVLRVGTFPRHTRVRPNSTTQSATTVRVTFLALAFPLPAVLLYVSEPALAFVVQYAGLLAERWLFFAESLA